MLEACKGAKINNNYDKQIILKPSSQQHGKAGCS